MKLTAWLRRFWAFLSARWALSPCWNFSWWSATRLKETFQLMLLVYFSIQLQTEVKNIVSLKLNPTLHFTTLGCYFEKLVRTNNTFFVWKIHFIAYLSNFLWWIQNKWDQAQKGFTQFESLWQTCYDQCTRRVRNHDMFENYPLCPKKLPILPSSLIIYLCYLK